MYELLLISVVVACGYWGQFFVRKQPHGTATFGQMQLAAAGFALLGIWANHGGPAALGVVGGIGIGMGTCLLVLGPLVRSVARRFAVADRLGIATRLLDIAEILNPGSGVGEEKALLGAMKEIREGKIEQTIDALAAARDRAPAESRIAIDERIAMLYLAAHRWDEAITFAETHLFARSELVTPLAEPPPRREQTKSELATPLAEPPPGSLREALGIAPPVWVELLAAYGRVGKLERAATMLVRLEDACVGRTDSGVWVHRARMMFLALAGRAAVVEAMVAPRRARHMSVAARWYWLGVAHEHHGDRIAATAAYAKARSRSRGKPREMIDRAVAALADARPIALSDTTAEVVARIEAAPIPETPALERRLGAWATLSVTAAILGVAGAVALFIGPSGDLGVLVRAGAMVRGLVDHGEWWRVIASMFLHVGAVHLLVNTLGVWFLGRLTEDMFGGSRTITIFAGAGVAGQLASYLASPASVSAGASGAIFGLLGAVFAELTIHRKHYRAAWKRGMWGSLAIVALAQIGIDFMYPMFDQWAHGMGLLAGAVLGLALSPTERREVTPRRATLGRLALHAARAIAIVFAVAVGFAAVMVVRTSLAASLTDAPRARRLLGDLEVTIPSTWIAGAGGVTDPDGLISLTVGRPQPGAPTTAIAMWIAEEPARAKTREFDAIETPVDRLIPLPTGWEGVELVVSFADGLGYRQRFRVVACGRALATGRVITASLYVPESIAAQIPEFLTQLIASLR